MKKTKILWIDTETTGLEPKRNDIIQLAILVDIDGAIVDRGFWEIRPIDPLTISEEALACNMLTKEAVMAYRPASDIFKELIKFLDKYIDRYDKQDKFWIAGYNVKFDIDFLRGYFDKMGHKYYGSYFRNYYIDVMAMAMLNSFINGELPESFKLADVANSFKLESVNFHHASADINITRDVFLKLMEKFKEKPLEAF